MDDLTDTMRDAPGVGLAAPQIGVPLSVVVIEVPADEEANGAAKLLQLADPELVHVSAETEEGQEACLSIPGYVGEVQRHVEVTVRALNRAGKQVTIQASDLEARILQHEIDHLEGVLFTDRITSMEKLYRLEEGEDGEPVAVPVGSGPRSLRRTMTPDSVTTS
jgi:peptide deformylase